MKYAFWGLLIAVVAFGALATASTTPFVQALIALPGAAGLLTALWDIAKARVEHEHRREEAIKANAFVVSATSHMAEVAFDKHVTFCEAYVAKANEGLTILFHKGPAVDALDVATDLSQIRRIHTLWESQDVSTSLEKFERALREIGADVHFLKSAPVGEERTRIVKEMYDTFRKVVGLAALPDQSTPEVAVSHIIERLRDLLDITKLTALRKHYIGEAFKRMK